MMVGPLYFQKGSGYRETNQRTGWTPGSLDVHALCPAALQKPDCNSPGPNLHYPGHGRRWREERTTEEILGTEESNTDKIIIIVRNIKMYGKKNLLSKN